MSLLCTECKHLGGKINEKTTLYYIETGRFYSPWLTDDTIVWAWADKATKPLAQGRHFSWLDMGRNVLEIAIGIVIVIFVF